MEGLDTEDMEFGELTEEKRMQIIDVFIAHKGELEAIPELKGLARFSLELLMNAECLICRSNRIHSGKCYGRIGVIPCLMFAVSDKTIAEWFERKG